jgi:hypothetical protein
VRWPKTLFLPSEMRTHLCTVPPAPIFFKLADGEIVGKNTWFCHLCGAAMAKIA